MSSLPDFLVRSERTQRATVNTKSNTSVRARIDARTKERALSVFDAMGLSISDDIRLLMQYIAEEQRLPLALKAPNATTQQAIAELDTGKGKKFSNVDDLMADLTTDD